MGGRGELAPQLGNLDPPLLVHNVFTKLCQLHIMFMCYVNSVMFELVFYCRRKRKIPAD